MGVRCVPGARTRRLSDTLTDRAHGSFVTRLSPSPLATVARPLRVEGPATEALAALALAGLAGTPVTFSPGTYGLTLASEEGMPMAIGDTAVYSVLAPPALAGAAGEQEEQVRRHPPPLPSQGC